MDHQQKKNHFHHKPDELERFIDFFNNFQDQDGNFVYTEILQRIANNKERALHVALDHIKTFFAGSAHFDLYTRIEQNALRYQGLAALASDRCMPATDDGCGEESTVSDLYTQQRRAMIERARENGLEVTAVPLQLLQQHTVHFLPIQDSAPRALRSVGADHIGGLVTLQGLVVKVSDVQPAVQVQTYLCNTCGYESYQTIDLSQHYSPLQHCPSPLCVANQSKGDLRAQLRLSKLVPQQTIVIQELQHEVPVGGVARTMRLVANASDLVHVVKPGNLVTVTGIYLPEYHTGFKGIRSGLLSDQYMLLQAIHVNKKSYQTLARGADMQLFLEKMAKQGNIYEKLAAFISPEIYGHTDTKKALLLSMVGGVTRTMADGMKIRGDINVMLVGDPGMAKSQILKYVHNLAPRSVYTTGKGASGVGLTAAVQRDPKTGEISLEGGALVLADMGICCIDEFDKMGEEDRTAIHEVMEQQTVSISKAGITTSLNARTTVLAAANPSLGKYMVHRSLSENMNMPPALLSRFDLIFILLDKPCVETDLALAEHIAYVHKFGKPPSHQKRRGNNENDALNDDDDDDDEEENELDINKAQDTGYNLPQSYKLTPELFRNYIAYAKSKQPVISKDVVNYITNRYVTLRTTTSAEDGAAAANSSTGNSRERFCTARQLLGIIRIAQAHAKIHFRDQVIQQDVDEALRLLDESKAEISLNNHTDQSDLASRDPATQLWDHFKRQCYSDPQQIVYKQTFIDTMVAQGHTEQNINAFLTQYSDAQTIVETTPGRYRLVDDDL